MSIGLMSHTLIRHDLQYVAKIKKLKADDESIVRGELIKYTVIILINSSYNTKKIHTHTQTTMALYTEKKENNNNSPESFMFGKCAPTLDV